MLKIAALIHKNPNYILKKLVKQHQVIICKYVCNTMHLYAVKKKVFINCVLNRSCIFFLPLMNSYHLIHKLFFFLSRTNVKLKAANSLKFRNYKGINLII